MWGVDVATCFSSCSLLLAGSPPGGASGACGRAAAVSAWAGPGGGVPGVGGRGGDGGGGQKDPTGTLAPPRPPPGVGWPSRPRAGRHWKREPPTRPEARRTAVRRQATSATTTSRGAGRHCGPCSPPGLSPTPPHHLPGGGWVGMPRWPRPTHPRAGVGGGAGRPGGGWQGAGGGVAPRRGWRGDGGGAAHLVPSSGRANLLGLLRCGSGRGFSLSREVSPQVTLLGAGAGSWLGRARRRR